MGKGKGGGGEIEVNEYLMSMHVGVALSVDYLKSIYVGEKLAWSGSLGSSPSTFQINASSLFGGQKKEGGVQGTCYWLPGGPSQVLPDELAYRLGRASGADCPGFRGLSSLFFTGAGGFTYGIGGGLFGSGSGTYVSSGQGFHWVTNNPYLKDLWVKVQRAPKGLNPANSMIGNDANPAHMIYECLTNREWAMGSAPSMLDVGSFEHAAATLSLEGLGLSMIWTRQTTIEAFVTEILDHIQATLFVNPRNGLLTLKLIRGDYDIANLRHITVDNATMSNFQRKAWGEVVSEIVVTWTNPENEQEETVSLQDNAAVANQGGQPVSDSRNYYGVRSADLAMKLCARDLRVAATPLASCDVELDRKAWDLLPGEVVKLTWAERGLYAVPMRVGSVDYGRPGEPSIKAPLVEDIFGYATTDYSVPPSSEWQDENVVPAPMLHPKVFTVPSFFAANYLPQVGTTGLADIQYPEVIAGVLASSPNAIAYDLYGDKVNVDGSVTQETFTTNTVAGRATLTIPLAEAATSQFVAFTNFTGRVVPTTNSFVFIGGVDKNDANTEIALITDTTSTGFTLKRGILDTVPRAWDAGTPCYFIELASVISEKLIRSDAESVTYKLLSRTVGGILDIASAGAVTGTLNGRPHYPLRPANVKVGGQAFGTVDISAVDPVPVTWANRNRTMENSQVVYWDDATVTPEAGQTTTVELRTEGGSLLASYTGLAGTSTTFPKSALGSNTRAVVVVKAVRDGFESLQAHRIIVDTTAGSGSGGGTGGGGGTGTYPSSVTWTSFEPVVGTAYSDMSGALTVSSLSGSTITANASLTYENESRRSTTLNAKWQYRIAGTTDWVDIGTPGSGTPAFVTPDFDYVTGSITVNRTLTGMPANDYEVRLVANASFGGVSLSVSGAATVTVTGGTPPPSSG